jgi:hypothetical protein
VKGNPDEAIESLLEQLAYEAETESESEGSDGKVEKLLYRESERSRSSTPAPTPPTISTTTSISTPIDETERDTASTVSSPRSHAESLGGKTDSSKATSISAGSGSEKKTRGPHSTTSVGRRARAVKRKSKL